MTITKKLAAEQLNIRNLVSKSNYHKHMYEKYQSIFDVLIDLSYDWYITAIELYHMCNEKEKEILINKSMDTGAILNMLMDLYPSFVEKQQAFYKNVYHIPAHLKDLEA